MDAGVDLVLSRMSEILEEYQVRVESIESFVYMQCVGIQLEKHFSQRRSQALAGKLQKSRFDKSTLSVNLMFFVTCHLLGVTGWEKKTDITTAINVATRKGLPLLVNELQSKMDNLMPRNVSHTTVKETKETHLLSKTLKTELQELANRRFLRDRETATHRVVMLMMIWAKCECWHVFVALLAFSSLHRLITYSWFIFHVQLR